MNIALHRADLAATMRLQDADSVGRRGVGRYLSQNVLPGNIPRLLYYLETLKEIAYKLEPVRGAHPNLLN
ncbi:MAG: hypothetical protein ACREV5_19740 [Steroidobacter sp.]